MKKTLTALAAVALLASPLVAVAAPMPAQPRAATTTDARTGERLATAKARALEEIDRRVGHLEALRDRVSHMARLSDTNEAEIGAIVTGQITALTALRTEIDAATDAATLRELVRQITESYRIYALILPQIQIIAAADRTLAVASQLGALADKLEGRMSTASTTTDVANAFSTSLAKVREAVKAAETNASEAITAVLALRPDNGDDASREANRTALKHAHAKVRAAHQSLVEARKFAGEIVRDLRALTKGTATTTPAQG